MAAITARFVGRLQITNAKAAPVPPGREMHICLGCPVDEPVGGTPQAEPVRWITSYSFSLNRVKPEVPQVSKACHEVMPGRCVVRSQNRYE